MAQSAVEALREVLRLNRDRIANMGMVLSFSPRAVSGRHKPNGELAAVIIFPGVRYERLEKDQRLAASEKTEQPTGKSAH